GALPSEELAHRGEVRHARAEAAEFPRGGGPAEARLHERFERFLGETCLAIDRGGGRLDDVDGDRAEGRQPFWRRGFLRGSGDLRLDHGRRMWSSFRATGITAVPPSRAKAG